MTDAFRRLGQRTAQIAPTRTGDLGAALAQVLAPQAAPPAYQPSVTPSVAPPAPTRQFGQQAAQAVAPWMQQAIGPAVTLANQLMQQQQDEPWVEVVNESDEDDFLFMPRSYANNPPVGWYVAGEVDQKDRDFVESDANAYNIFQQPPDVQASWGIAMPGGQVGYSDPKDAAPMDTSIIRGPQAVIDPIAQATGQAVGQFGGDASRAMTEAQARLGRLIEGLGMEGTQPAYDFTTERDRQNEQAAPGYQPPDDTAWLDDMLNTPIFNTGRTIRDIPELITTGSGVRVGSGDARGDGSDVLGPTLPGTTIPAARALDQAQDVAEDVRNAPYGDLVNLPSTGSLVSLVKEVNDLRDGGWKNPGEWSDLIGSVFGAGAESSPLVEILFGAAEAPSEWWKSAQSSAILNGEIDFDGAGSGVLDRVLDAIPGADTALARMLQAAAVGENNIDQIIQIAYGSPVFGASPIGTINVDGGNVTVGGGQATGPDFAVVWPLIQETIPTHYAAWIEAHPAEARKAYSEGGAAAVWEIYQADTEGGWLGAAQRLWRDYLNDPTAVAAVAAPMFGRIGAAGQAMRMAPSAGVIQRTIGTILEQTGTVGRTVSRGTEMVGDLFIEPAGRAALGTVGNRLNQASNSVVAARERGEQPSVPARIGDTLNIFRTSDAGMRAAQSDAFEQATSGPMLRAAADARDIGPDDGGPSVNPPEGFDPDAPRPDAPDAPAPEGGSVAEDGQRAERARTIPEPAPEEIAVGEGVPYSPNVRVRRTEDGWQVQGPRADAEDAPAGTWDQALDDAEILRREMGDAEGDIIMVPPRWIEDIEGSSMLDGIMRQMTPPQRTELRRAMADDWYASVDTQASIGRGRSTVDHALESSRIALRTADRAQQINPNVSRPAYRPTYAGERAQPQPFHAMSEAIFLPWDETRGARAYLYGARNHNWSPKNSKKKPARNEKNWMTDTLGENPTPAQVAAARRYLDLVDQHAQWFPEDVGERWVEAQRKADALRDHPALREREATPPPARADVSNDLYTDTRYDSEVISQGDERTGDGTVTRYQLDDDTYSEVTTRLKAKLPKVVQRRNRTHPRAGDPVWFEGDVYRDGEHVGHVAVQPDVREVNDHLKRLADEGEDPFATGTVPPRPEPDAPQAAEPETPTVPEPAPEVTETPTPAQEPEPQAAQAQSDTTGSTTPDTTLQTQAIPEAQPRQPALVEETPQPRRRTQAAERTEDAAPLGRTIRNQTEQPGTKPVEAETDAPKSERITDEDRPRAGSIDPRALTLDPSLFQFRSTLDNPTGVNQVAVDRMVREWDPLQQDPVIVWERTPGELVVTSGHHRVTAARIRTERGTPTPVDYVIKDFDASDIASIRDKARRSNKGTVKESPVDIAHQVKSLEAENPDWTDVRLAREVDRRVEDITDFRNIAHLPDALKRVMNAGFDFKAGRFTNGFMFKQAAGSALGEQIRLGRIDGAAAQDFHARYDGAGLSTDEFVQKVKRNIGLMAEKVNLPEETTGTLFNVGDFGSSTYARIDAIDDQILAEKRKLKAEQGTLKKANELEDTSPAERTRNEAKIARREKAIARLETQYQKAMDRAVKDINAAPPNPTNVVPASTLDVPSVYDEVATPPPAPNGAATPVTLPARIRNMPEQVSGPDDPAVNGSAFSKADDPAQPVTIPSSQALFADASAQARANARRAQQQHVAWMRLSTDGVRGMIARERITRAHRPLPRIDRVTDTGNNGYLFGEALGWQEEVFLTKNKLADGQTLLGALESYKHQYMTGKSVMWPPDAEQAAIRRVRELWQERLDELYPGGTNTPPFLRGVGDVLDGMMQYFRETVLWNHLRWVSYPLTQAAGNTAILLVAGRPHWVLPMWSHVRGARREMRYHKAISDLDTLNKKIAAYHKTDKPGPVAKRAQEARLKARESAITNVMKRLETEHGGVAALKASIAENPNVLREVWMADPGLSASGKLHASLNTRAGRELRDMYQGFTGSLDDPLIVQQILGGLGEKLANEWGRRIGHNVGKLAGSKRIAKWGAYWDLAMRDTIWEKTMRGELRDAMPDFRNAAINRHMAATGATRAKATAFWEQFWDSTDGVFSSVEVRRHYATVLEPGQAERIGRDWQGHVTKMEQKATSEVKRISFAGDEMRADIFLRKVMVFHHFFTRQAYFFGVQALRHPVLLNIYEDVQEELADYAEANEGIVPDWMKGWVAMLGVPGVGINLFLNPTTMFSTYLMFRSQSTFVPDNMSGVGGWLSEIDDFLGLNPFLMVGANLLGLMGEGYPPDPLFLYNQTEFITRAINFGRARGWLGDDPTPIGNGWTDWWAEQREKFSGMLPGSETIEATSSQAAYDREIRMIGVDEAAAMGRPVVITEGMTDEEKAEVQANRQWFAEEMADPDSELYQRSVKRWSAGEIVQSAGNFVLGPFRPRWRMGMTSDEEGGEGTSVAGLPGTSPDIAGVLSGAEDAPWGLINAGSPESLRLNSQADGYYTLGTERQQAAAKSYNLIYSGTGHYGVTVNGTYYSPLEISNMPQEQRADLAQAYLQQQGYWDEWQDLQGKQDAFLAEQGNADFAQMKAWQKEVYAYEGGPVAYWEAYLERNPDNKDAQRYYESVLDANFLKTDQEKALAGMHGYMTTKGIRAGAYDGTPDLSWHQVNDPVGTLNTPPQPTPNEPYVSAYDQAVIEGVPKAAADYQAWDDAVRGKMTEFGIDPSIPFSELPTKTRISIEDSLEADGVYEPKVDWQVNQYMEWVNQQPLDADISVDAYLAWSEEQYEQGATARFEESIAMPDLTPREQAEVLERLRREHDHKYQP